MSKIVVYDTKSLKDNSAVRVVLELPIINSDWSIMIYCFIQQHKQSFYIFAIAQFNVFCKSKLFENICVVHYIL